MSAFQVFCAIILLLSCCVTAQVICDMNSADGTCNHNDDAATMVDAMVQCPSKHWYDPSLGRCAPSLSQLVVNPQLVAGLNNQLISFVELVKIAAHVHATSCYPLVNLEGVMGSPLTPRPFAHLFDTDHFTTCVAHHFNASMATRSHDIAMCNYLVNTTATNEWRWSGGPPWNASSMMPTIPGWEHVTDFHQSIRTFPQIPLSGARYEAAARNGHPVLMFRDGTFNHYRRHPHLGDSGLPMLSEGCIRFAARWEDMAARILSYAHSLSPSSITIGIHLRMEFDMKCAPSIEWVTNRLCSSTELGVPCINATCIIATGMVPSEYVHLLPCARVVSKEMVLSKQELAYLYREERAALDMILMRETDYFFGCGGSTFTMATWAMRQAPVSIPSASLSSSSPSQPSRRINLSYGLLNDVCWPGNRRQIQRVASGARCDDDYDYWTHKPKPPPVAPTARLRSMLS